MRTVPCRLCGYHAPDERCPHCGHAPVEASLARPLRGGWTGALDGLLALPKGLAFLARTPGLKRWLLPPLLVTSALLLGALWFLAAEVDRRLDAALPEGIVLDESWSWLDELSARWDWLKASWVFLVGAAEWTLNQGWVLVTSQPLRLVGWFLVGSLVAWYCFSIAYEALAGPFLDEVQGRLETRWFGEDPRSRLERPNDIPVERCIALSAVGLAFAAAAGALAWTSLGGWYALLALPLIVLPGALVDRRYGAWAAWVLRVEAVAIRASLQATVLTTALLILALPLYFVPFVGYFLFAVVCGFATAVGLLDIPLERRGWRLNQRVRLVTRHLLPFTLFGVAAGLLLSVPIVGPVLMVPSASIGGLWLICRLDKEFLREGGV